MLRSEIEKKLLESVKIGNNAKKTAIMEWCSYYWKFFEEMPESTIDFIAKKLSEEDSWDAEEIINKEKLDGKIILSGKTIEENPLTVFIRYEIACCSCNETYIRKIFNEFPSEPNKLLTLEDVKSLDKNYLMIFWSHYINQDKLGNHDNFGDKTSYKNGFQYAIKDKNIGAMDFFWNQIKNDLSITDDEKKEICMQPALYRGMNTGSNADMIEFTIKCLDELGDTDDKYHELLKTEFKIGGAYLTIHKLKLEYRFNSAKKLFKSLKPDDVSCAGYTSSMFGLLNALTKIAETVTSDLKSKDDFGNTKSFTELEQKKLLEEGEELLSVMWNPEVFGKQTKYFIEKEINAQFSPARERIVSLINMKKIFNSEILSNIVKSIEEKHMKRINIVDPSSAKILNIFRQKICSFPESGTSSDLKIDPSFDIHKPSLHHKETRGFGDQ